MLSRHKPVRLDKLNQWPFMQSIHANSVNSAGNGILIRGPSGSGKSDLTLRLIDDGDRLIADDQTQIGVESGSVFLSVPACIAGKIEIRGYGISHLPYDENIILRLIVNLKTRDSIERMPEIPFETLLGVKVPALQLNAFDASAVAKIHAVLVGLKHE